MHIFLTTTERANPLVARLIPQMQDALRELEPRYSLAGDASHADAILFVESGSDKFSEHAAELRNHPAFRSYPGQCFIYDFTDKAAAFLPGLYTSMPEPRFVRRTMRTIPSSWDDTADAVFEEAVARASSVPSFLLSFRGFRSSRLREHLFATEFDEEQCPISETHDWWTYDAAGEGRLSYLTEIRSSLFPLAPRGLGTSTLRLYEIMRLGRAPVILSDAWVAPEGIPWSDFSLRVSEHRVEQLPEILSAYRPWAAEMGERARAAWEQWCRPGPPLMRYMAQSLESILLLREPAFDGAALEEEWSSQRFMWLHGWHPLQRVARSVRNGTLGDVIRARLRRIVEKVRP